MAFPIIPIILAGAALYQAYSASKQRYPEGQVPSRGSLIAQGLIGAASNYAAGSALQGQLFPAAAGAVGAGAAAPGIAAATGAGPIAGGVGFGAADAAAPLIAQGASQAAPLAQAAPLIAGGLDQFALPATQTGDPRIPGAGGAPGFIPAQNLLVGGQNDLFNRFGIRPGIGIGQGVG